VHSAHLGRNTALWLFDYSPESQTTGRTLTA